MLDLAIRHADELKKLMLEILDKPEYFFYSSSSWLKPLTIEENDWNYIERVSLVDGKVKGYFSADIDRDSNLIQNLAIINFDLKHNSFVFSRDLERFVDYLLVYKQFRKIKFWCFAKNPARDMYEYFIDKFKGRRVGVYENDKKLQDGNYYSVVLYEISREAYMYNRRLK